MTEQQPELHDPQNDIPLMEWIAATLGFVIVATVISFLIYEAINNDAVPPILNVTITEIRELDDTYLVLFEVYNRGTMTAAAVSVEGQLLEGEQSIESRSSTLTYVPPKSVRRGGLYFSRNPGDFRLEVQATGYEEP
jgi:uncharacterized protein (TIGR02588 family)